MPLRIRRGTDAERVANNFRPAQGELIFTTDTKKLYVGDGSTIGGTLVTGEGGGGGVGDSTVVPTTINDLSDVDVAGAISGSVLKYDGGNWVVGVDTAGSGGGASVLGDLTNVNFSNTPQDRWILRYDLSSDEWIADPDDTGLNYPTLVSLTDTDFSNPPQDGWVLKYDLANTRWIAAAEVIGSTLTSNLDANGYSISDVGTITSTADITTTGDVNATNLNVTTLLVTNQIDATGIIATDIGMKGDILKDDGVTKVLDYVAGEFTGNVTGNVTGNASGDHTGTFTGAITATGTLEGNIKGDIRATNDVTVLSSGSDGTNATFTGDVTGNLVGNVDGDLLGSVFADNSSLIINGLDGGIHASIIHAKSNNLDIVGDTDVNPLDLNITSSASEPGRANFSRKDLTADLSLDTISNGRVTFGRNDINGAVTTSFINGRNDCLFLFANTTGNAADVASYVTLKDQKLGIGTVAPAEELDVQGNAVVTGFVQFGSLTTAERDALTAADGMVIYNTTDNKFQGRENGVWVNLV